MAKSYGEWLVEESIGEGGQAHTFLVTRQRDGQQGALKRLKNVDSPPRLERFRHEADAVKNLQHPGIPQILDLQLAGAEPYIVFERRSGRDLTQANEVMKDPLRALTVLIKAFVVMEYVHAQGYCHRDLKPEHIIIDEEGNVSIIDFGLVYCDQNERVTMTDEAVGSFRYMAPELEDGRGKTDLAVDVYSLGKLIYYLLSGRREFAREKHRDEAFDLVSLHNDLRYERVNELLDKMICANPGERFPDAGAALQELVKVREYFRMVVWERNLTINEPELRQRPECWRDLGDGIFTNQGNENMDWLIEGPFEGDAAPEPGLYEAAFRLRIVRWDTEGAGGYALIAVTSSAGGDSGTAVLAGKFLQPEDMRRSREDRDVWREHRLLFFQSGVDRLQLRIKKRDGPRGIMHSGHLTLEFGGIRLRKLFPQRS